MTANPEVAPWGSVPPRVHRILMAGGGTGGHLYPGLALVEALTRRLGDEFLELTWAATSRPVDQHLLGFLGDRYICQPVQPLVFSPGKIWGFWRGWRRSCSFWAAHLDRHSVDCVVALGGYAAGPATHVAARRGVPVVLLNPDALPGRANRFLLRHADIVVTQWPMDPQHEFRIKGTIKALGCPIRAELSRRTRQEGLQRLGLDLALRTLVVTGASLGARTINDALLSLLENSRMRHPFAAPGISAAPDQASAVGQFPAPALPEGWQILHLAGTDQASAVRAAYQRLPTLRVKVLDYCDDMASVWAVADLAIARAGASTCAELAACGVPSILMPYPFHRDMHQRANARQLEKGGAAIIVDDRKDPRLNAQALGEALLPLLYDDSRRGAMAAAARHMGKPDAADAIAAEILGLIGSSSR